MDVSGFKQKVVVVGGGLTGLAAAYELQKQQQEIDITLVESTHRLGGKIQTLYKNGFVIERGPDSFLERKVSMNRLAEEIGLGDRLINNATGRAFVLVNDTLHPMPGGSVMGIPTHMRPFMTTGLFSMTGKMRAAADFVLPRSSEPGDQSLGQFFRRRLGNEVVENLIEPLLSGIYAGDIDRLSLMSTFPQFHQVEQDHRSLILGMKKTTPAAPAPAKPTGERKKGVFSTLTSGLQSFVERMEEVLTQVEIMKGVKVEQIETAGSSAHRYKLTLTNGETLFADSIIVTAPHQAAVGMFQDQQLMSSFKEMPSTTVATVAMAFPIEAIPSSFKGSGFVVSRNSDFTITACTWTHNKWPHTAPEGKGLLRCYVGRAGDEAVVDLSDDQIEAIVLEDLRKILDLPQNPEFTVVTRWKKAMPQYTVGHKQRVAAARSSLEQAFPGVYLAGSSYDGLGLPDCVDQGERAANLAMTFLKNPVTS